MTPFTRLTSRTLVLPQADVDTDQIIPARFLKTTERAGLGRHLFADRRLGADGRPDPAFPFDAPDAAERAVLVAGANFGCGSSREHAVWALLDAGVRAVISTRIADIFRGNALRNGLLPLALDEAWVARLMAAPGAEVTIDLEAERLSLADGASTPIALEPFARHCLLAGVDELGFLLGQEESIRAFEERRPCAP